MEIKETHSGDAPLLSAEFGCSLACPNPTTQPQESAGCLLVRVFYCGGFFTQMTDWVPSLCRTALAMARVNGSKSDDNCEDPPHASSFRFIPGQCVVGEIVEIGSACNCAVFHSMPRAWEAAQSRPPPLAVGDVVVGLLTIRTDNELKYGGGVTSFALVPAQYIFRLSTSVARGPPLNETTSLLYQSCAAGSVHMLLYFRLMHVQLALQRQARVLFTDAAKHGAFLGQQLAKKVLGCSTTCVVEADEEKRLLSELGIPPEDIVVIPQEARSTQNVMELVQRLTGGAGFSAVIVSGSTAEDNDITVKNFAIPAIRAGGSVGIVGELSAPISLSTASVKCANIALTSPAILLDSVCSQGILIHEFAKSVELLCAPDSVVPGSAQTAGPLITVPVGYTAQCSKHLPKAAVELMATLLHPRLQSRGLPVARFV